MKAKKKPLREFAQVTADGTTYTVVLHGRSRKRVIVGYMYWDETGGLKGWEPYDIYDRTFVTEQEAAECDAYFICFGTFSEMITSRIAQRIDERSADGEFEQDFRKQTVEDEEEEEEEIELGQVALF